MKQTTKFTVLVGAAGLASATAVSLWRAPPERSAAPKQRSQPALETRLGELQKEVAELRRLALTLQRAQGETTRSIRTLPAPSPPEESLQASETAVGESAREPTSPRAPTAELIRDLLDARFSAEPDDHAWSRVASEQARAVVRNRLEHPSRQFSLECRSTLCRAEIEQPDEAAHRGYLDDLLNASLGWEGTLMASLVQQSPGSYSTVVFLARPGTELLSEAELAEPL
jgi:hypothetical protein